jgi:2-polyprenyl-3-methyl-5-hydroxy-6-metoxy-1,4-benzoquinol methylase
MLDLPALLGPIDIYLVDQVLRGRIAPGMTLCDVGCGGGRNLFYFLRAGYRVYGLDPSEPAIRAVRSLAADLAPQIPPTNFRAESAEASSFPPELGDVVISSAVLHFARDAAQFQAMLAGSWRLLKKGGVFFCRLASTIGMEGHFVPLGQGRFHLPDGSERFLVDEARLLALTEGLGGMLLDPIKTTVVQDQRCMTTWVLRKGG